MYPFNRYDQQNICLSQEKCIHRRTRKLRRKEKQYSMKLHSVTLQEMEVSNKSLVLECTLKVETKKM